MEIHDAHSKQGKLVQGYHLLNSFFSTVRALDSIHGNLTTFHLLDTGHLQKRNFQKKYFLCGFYDATSLLYPVGVLYKGKQDAWIHK